MSAKRITIDQDAELICGQFSIEPASLADLNANKTDFVLTQGYGGNNITVLTGTPDDWTIRLSENSCDISASGRDMLKNAVDTFYQNTVFLFAPAGLLDEVGNKIPFIGGAVTASKVAYDACKQAGLELLWEAPDYAVVNEIHDTQGFSGTVAEILSQLVQPLQQTEMFKIDIYAIGNTVHIKKRVWPYVPDYEIALADVLKLTGFSIKKNVYRGVPIKSVMLKRQVAANSASKGIESEELRTETYSPDGILVGREITITKKMNGQTTSQEKTSFRGFQNDGNIVLVSKSSASYDYIGQLNYQKVTAINTSSVIYEPITENNNSTYLARETKGNTTFNYLNDQLREEVIATVSNYYSSTGNLKVDAQGKPLSTVEIDTTTHTSLDMSNVSTVKTKTINGILVAKSEEITAGQLPGPRKVGGIRGRNGATTTWAKLITVGATGKQITLSNDLLSESQMVQVANEIGTQQKAVKYELNMPLIPMPWIRKGMKVRFIGTVSDGCGNTFDLSQLVFLITHITSVQDEKSFTGALRGEAWL